MINDKKPILDEHFVEETKGETYVITLKQDINVAGLDMQLRGAMGDKFSGVAVGAETKLIFKGKPSTDELTVLNNMIELHDPTYTPPQPPPPNPAKMTKDEILTLIEKIDDPKLNLILRYLALRPGAK